MICLERRTISCHLIDTALNLEIMMVKEKTPIMKGVTLIHTWQEMATHYIYVHQHNTN